MSYEGGMMVAPAPTPAPMPPAEAVPAPKKTTKASTAATIVVSLPAEATLTVDDTATTSTSASRVFFTPALEEGKEFSYTLKATVVREGTPVSISKQVAVRAGLETRVTLDIPTTSVASK